MSVWNITIRCMVIGKCRVTANCQKPIANSKSACQHGHGQWMAQSEELEAEAEQEQAEKEEEGGGGGAY